LTSVWTSASTEPTTIVRIATPHVRAWKSHSSPGITTYTRRRIAPNAATLVHAAIKPVIGVGAPWYTSGVHAWNGAAPTLNSSPISTRSTPATRSPSRPEVSRIACEMSVNLTEPAKPYSSAVPNRKNAEANAPSRKYLSEASCERSRRRRASPASRYSGRESTSSAMNMVRRSPAAGKTIMPPTANITSGYTSVCTRPARRTWSSYSVPGTAAACGANASSRSDVRSAITSSPRKARIAIVPCANSAGPSSR